MNTYYEFFAGGGMARAGLGPDWECLLANDISIKKGSAYRANWGDEHLRVEDIFNLNPIDLPGHADLAWGSFPCQDLSLAGIGQGLQGARSGAFWGFWRLIEGLNKAGRKPRVVILENVVGALTSRNGKDFEQIAKAVVSEGYCVGAIVMDAVHFVPQSRPRVFIVGVDKDMLLSRNIHSKHPSSVWHSDALMCAFNRLPSAVKSAWRWWSLPRPAMQSKVLADIVELEPQGVRWHTPAETQKILSMMTDVNRCKVIEAQRSGSIKVGAIYKRTREGVQRAEVRFDGVAGCLRTPVGGSSRQVIMIVDGPQVRTRLISSREAARLMGLPEAYVLPERYNDAYHLLGDGVVVDVVAYLKTHLLAPIMSDHAMMEVAQARQQCA